MRKKITILLLCYVVLRCFVYFSTYWIRGDEARYLALAKHFPSHELFNQQYYLAHPVLFPYLIKFMSLFVGLVTGGLLLSLLSSILLFFVLYSLLKYFNYADDLLVVFLFFISTNELFLLYSQNIFREMTFALFYFGTILFILRKKWILAGIFAVGTILLSFQAVFLIATLFGIMFLYQKSWKQISIIIMMMVVAFSFAVVLPRYIAVHHSLYYPAGGEGLIEEVTHVSLSEFINPYNFPWSKEIMNDYTSLTFNPFTIIQHITALLNPWRFQIISNTLQVPTMILTIPLLILALVGIYLQRRSKITHLMLVIAIFAVYPCFTNAGYVSRFSMNAVIPLFFFITLSITFILKKYIRYVSIILLTILILFTIAKFAVEPHFLLFSNEEYRLGETAVLLKGLPGDIYLSDGIYGPDLVLTTEKRVLPIFENTPLELTETLVSIGKDYFNASYILVGEMEEFNRVLQNTSVKPSSALKQYALNHNLSLVGTYQEEYSNDSNAWVKKDSIEVYALP